MYLDEILFTTHPAMPGKQVIEMLGMTSSEVYVLLCAILFHDLGRSYKGKYSHACESRITLAVHYKDLGLESEELALCIGRICHFHDPEDVDRGAKISSKSNGVKEDACPVQLRNVTITGYGVIREKLLGALLVLIDHQDGTFSRVLPHYVRMNNFGDIGKFRARIPGIRVDFSSRMVVTAVINSLDTDVSGSKIFKPTILLNEKALELKNLRIRKGLRFQIGGIIKPKKTLIVLRKEIDSTLPATLKGGCPNETSAKKIQKLLERFQDETACCRHDTKMKELWCLIRRWRNVCMKNANASGKRIKSNEEFSLFHLNLFAGCQGWENVGVLIARNMAFIVRLNDKSEQQTPSPFLLATIAGNTLENARSLNNISDTLLDYGIPLFAWLIECDEHLYTCFGAETYEPLLSGDFLSRLAQAMWNKSTRVFGRRIATYEGLASDLREANLERVRMGVRRLAIITRAPTNGRGAGSYSIHALEDGWQWNTQVLSLRVLMKNFIEKLVRPNSHIKEEPDWRTSHA